MESSSWIIRVRGDIMTGHQSFTEQTTHETEVYAQTHSLPQLISNHQLTSCLFFQLWEENPCRHTDKQRSSCCAVQVVHRVNRNTIPMSHTVCTL